jgi:hypothetical protein
MARLAPAVEAALSRRSPARVFDSDTYVITAQGEPAPAPQLVPGDVAPSLETNAAPRTPGGGSFGFRATAAREARQRLWRARRAALQRQGQERFVAFLKGKSDDQLDRIVGNNVVLGMIFKGMARSFDPTKAQGLDSGSIQYELKGARRTHRWAVRIAGPRATAMRGFAHDPVVTLRMTVATFGGIVGGDVDAMRAFFEGSITVEGDLGVAARLGELFGASSVY